MNILVKNSQYTKTLNNGDTEKKDFSFYTDLTAKNKKHFVTGATDLLVGDEDFHYIIRDLIFKFFVIDVFTDIDTTEVYDAIDVISAMEELVCNTDIADIVLNEIDDALISELKRAIKFNVEYRTHVHLDSIEEAVADLIRAIEKKTDGIDTAEMAESIKRLSSMQGEFGTENVLNAMLNTDAFLSEKEKRDNIVQLRQTSENTHADEAPKE